MDKPNNDISVDDLLAELQNEFGKKSRSKASRKAKYAEAEEQRREERIKLLHEAKQRLMKGEFKNIADYQTFKFMVESTDIAKQMDWRPSWIPEARITYVVRQHCENCGNTVSFIGGEYIKFRARAGNASIVKRADMFPDLFLYGWREEELPDQVDDLYQTVHRCPGCIQVEQMAIQLWEAATGEKQQQEVFPLEEPPQPKEFKSYKDLSGAELKAMIQREFGVKPVRVKRDVLEELKI